jgi:hypothetical protein
MMSAGHPRSLITVGLHILPVSGDLVHAKSEEWGIDLALKTSFKRLMREIDMSDRQKHNKRVRKSSEN